MNSNRIFEKKCILFWCTCACKTLKFGFFWYAVDTNLFRLDPKKNSQTMDDFWQGASPMPKKWTFFFFFSKMFEHFWTKNFFYIFFIKKFQIYMKDAEPAESKEKSNFRFFRFLFFELWSFFGIFFTQITPIFDEFSR